MANKTLEAFLQHLRRTMLYHEDGGISDGALLECFIGQRDEAAFAALLRRHGPMVLGVCRRVLHNEADVEDCFQATFLVLVRKAASIRPRGMVGNWLYAVARNAALKAKTMRTLRQRREREAGEQKGRQPAEQGPQLQELLDQELQALPDKYRAAIVLCDLEGKTILAASKELGCPRGTLNARLVRGRAMLGKRLAPRSGGIGRRAGNRSLPECGIGLCAGAVGGFHSSSRHLAGGRQGDGGRCHLGQGRRLNGRSVKNHVVDKTEEPGHRPGAGKQHCRHGDHGRRQPECRAQPEQKTPAAPGEQPLRDTASEPKPAPEAKPGRTDLFGDPLPAGAIARLGTVRLRHEGGVDAVVFSPDGKTLASASEDKTVRLWEVAGGKEIRQLRGHQDRVCRVVFSPDGKTLASASEDKTVRLWEATSGKEIRQFLGHQYGVMSVVFSPDGKTLASASRDHTVRLWDAASGEEIRQFQGHHNAVFSVAFSPDGKILASASEDLPDGKTLASSTEDRTVRLWEVATGKEIRKLQGIKHGVRFVAFSPDGKTLATSDVNHAVRFWEVASGKELPRPWENQINRFLAFSPDGKTFAGVDHGVLVLWELATAKEIRRFPGHEAGLSSVAFSPDGRILATAGDWRQTLIRLWDVATGKEVLQPQGHQDEVLAVAFSPDGKVVASASQDGTARLWDVASGKNVYLLQGHQSPVYSAAFLQDGKTLATASGNHTIRLWDTANGKEMRQLHGPQALLQHLGVSPDGKTVASSDGASPTLWLWDMASGKEIGKLIGRGRSPVGSVAFSPDSKTLASAGNYQPVRLWDIASGREIRKLEGQQEIIPGPGVFTPDGKVLVASSGGNGKTLRLWEVATGKEIRRLQTQQWCAWSVAISSDGRMLASAADDGTVVLWEMATGKELCRLRGQQGRLRSVAFSPDGKTMATAGQNTTVLIWLLSELYPAKEVPSTKLDPKDLPSLWADLANDDAVKGYQAEGTLIVNAKVAVPFLQEKLSTPTPERLRSQRAVMVLEQIGSPEAKDLLETLSKGAEGALLTEEAKAARKRMQR